MEACFLGKMDSNCSNGKESDLSLIDYKKNKDILLYLTFCGWKAQSLVSMEDDNSTDSSLEVDLPIRNRNLAGDEV